MLFVCLRFVAFLAVAARTMKKFNDTLVWASVLVFGQLVLSFVTRSISSPKSQNGVRENELID